MNCFLEYSLHLSPLCATNSTLSLGEWSSDVYELCPTCSPLMSNSSADPPGPKLCVSLNVTVLPLVFRVLLLTGEATGANASRATVLQVLLTELED